MFSDLKMYEITVMGAVNGTRERGRGTGSVVFFKVEAQLMLLRLCEEGSAHR